MIDHQAALLRESLTRTHSFTGDEVVEVVDSIATRQYNRYKLVSLWKIMKFVHAESIEHIGNMVELYRQFGDQLQSQLLTSIDRLRTLAVVKRWEVLCSELGLKASLATVSRMRRALEGSTCTHCQLGELANELHSRFYDELKSELFLHVDVQKARYYEDPLMSLDEVISKFPSSRFDLEEARRCLALDRWTAYVFHLSRVMEIGLYALGAKLGLEKTTNRTWDAILKKCEREDAKTSADQAPEWRQDAKFFSGVATMRRSVKNAWRNPTMHVEAKYTEEEASDICNYVVGFMRHLATKLAERDCDMA